MRDRETALTYAELDAAVRVCAGDLHDRGIRPEDVVAVEASPGIGLLVTLLAVVDRGAAFLLLDPADPAERRQALARLAGARHMVKPDSTTPGQAAGSPPVLDPTRVQPAHLAYVSFTSGSTGRPKGVMVSQASLAHYVAAAVERYDLHELAGERSIFHTSPSFDLCFTSIFPALAAGMTVEVHSREAADLDALLRLGRELSAPTGLLKVTPSHVRAWRLAGIAPPNARRVVIGGEALTRSDVSYLLSASGPTPLVFNEYGPTEATVGCLVHQCSPAQEAREIPLGDPLGAAVVRYVPHGHADEHEILVGGPGLARGYLGDPAATAERFVPDAAGDAGARVYVTGDVVIPAAGDAGWTFTGRADDQLNRRGYRVEPAEVEVAILSHPGCAEARAVAIEGDLVAVVRLVPGTELDDVRRSSTEVLPRHLLPGRWIVVEAMPLTRNGKLDHASLRNAGSQQGPAVDTSHNESHAAPKDALVADVARMMGELLDSDTVAEEADLFDLGGHSMLAIQLLARLEATFDARVSPSELLVRPLPGQPSNASAVGLARLVSATRRHAGRRVIRLQSGSGDAPTVALVHPAGRDFGGYRALSLELDEDLNIVATQSLASGNSASGYLSSAGRLASELDELCPGEIRLVGWSSGGVLAQAVAVELTARGRSALSLVVIDSFLADESTQPNGRADAAQHRRDAINHLAALNDGVAATRKGDDETELRDAADALGVSPVILQGHVAAYASHIEEVQAHRPVACDVPTLAVFAETHPRSAVLGATARWQALTSHDVVAATAAGDHDTVLAAPGLPATLGNAWHTWSETAQATMMEGSPG